MFEDHTDQHYIITAMSLANRIAMEHGTVNYKLVLDKLAETTHHGISDCRFAAIVVNLYRNRPILGE